MSILLTFALLAITIAEDSIYTPSRVTADCETTTSNCKDCWTDKPNLCYSCKTGYYFDNQGGCANSQNTIVAGYRRDCAICGVHNYPDESNQYRCAPCAYGCSKCNEENNGKCSECNPEYTLEDDGTCSCKIGQEIDSTCFCNKESFYIILDPIEGKQCIECDQCSRDVPNCDKVMCPKYTFDLDRKDCCTPCHYSCDECDGETSKDCLVKNTVRMCRNIDLWEEVPGLDECYCVCYADEEKDEDGISHCRCHSDRIATDLCANKDCNGYDNQHRWQCLCDPAKGYHEGPKDVNGHTTCELNA